MTNMAKMKIETLKLDYDNISFRDIYNIFINKNKWIIRYFKLKVLTIEAYTTKRGYHIYIKVNNRLSNQDLVFLQLAFSSDFMRECYYWKRIKYPILPRREWNILFFRKSYGRKSRKKPSKEVYDLKKSSKLMNLFEAKNVNRK